MLMFVGTISVQHNIIFLFFSIIEVMFMAQLSAVRELLKEKNFFQYAMMKFAEGFVIENTYCPPLNVR